MKYYNDIAMEYTVAARIEKGYVWEYSLYVTEILISH